MLGKPEFGFSATFECVGCKTTVTVTCRRAIVETVGMVKYCPDCDYCHVVTVEGVIDAQHARGFITRTETSPL